MGRIIRNLSLWFGRVAAKRGAGGIGSWLRRHRKGAAKLVELDPRTLQDIGLEAWRSPLGAKVALRRYEMRRWSASRIGLY